MASATDIGLMRVAIAEARIGQSEGEPPFGAVVADGSRTVVARAHDTVVGSGDMTRHSEVDAVRAACAKVGPDLSGHTSYATTEPCAMCFGAVPWSGINELVCGARKDDAESAGFDEGDKPDGWQGALKLRGINVQTDVLREQAAAVFEQYLASGGEIYNP